MTRLPGEFSGETTEFLLEIMRERRAQEEALGLRGYGRKKVDEALAKIDEVCKDFFDPVVHSLDEGSPGLLLLLEDAVRVVGQYDQIPHDPAAMYYLENFASVIGIAFELGRAAEGYKLDPQEWRRLQAQLNSKLGVDKLKGDADDKWRREVKLLHRTLRGQFAKGDDRRLSHGDLVKIVRDDPKTRIKGAPGERELRRQFSKWDAEATGPDAT